MPVIYLDQFVEPRRLDVFQRELGSSRRSSSLQTRNTRTNPLVNRVVQARPLVPLQDPKGNFVHALVTGIVMGEANGFGLEQLR